MKLLALKHDKRLKEDAQQRDEESRKTYRDYDWTKMFRDRSLPKLKASELDKYLTHHSLGKHRTKKAKLEAINKHIIQELSRQIEEDKEDYASSDSDAVSDSDSGEDSEEDYVLAELGQSKSEEEEGSDECENVRMPTVAETSVVYTRSGRRASQFRMCKKVLNNAFNKYQ